MMTQEMSAESTSPANTLVKYDTPILLSEAIKKKGNKALMGTSGKNKGQALPPIQVVGAERMTQTEDILNSILPPVVFSENNQQWIQYVSSTPATRLDVTNLEEALDAQLLKRKAKETGICPVREELYSQCFDELIRQVTVNCQQRGLLLLRVRNEIRMTIKAYKQLYESSVAFGMRKSLHAEDGKTEMELKIIQLEKDKTELEKQVKEWQAKCEATEKREREKSKQEKKKFEEEIAFLKKQNQQYAQELERLTMAKPNK
ncbi:hypothetical protein FDP41_003434 [Naegleria fowleri]|uniref:Uncharacterized protein n=1 Tax=Naegleria fowleri TaxID=5763 RepID=A0A6A5BRX2_NAEFO|nr:uncharacterized protein FDP41_003434 [Naegleria fowleri]KAF0977442.1 hypothetical protein FDP41_003434 [Naegleria fowleri]CAG4713362.1 unnamed protein product [Naegleria fowleri]